MNGMLEVGGAAGVSGSTGITATVAVVLSVVQDNDTTVRVVEAGLCRIRERRNERSQGLEGSELHLHRHVVAGERERETQENEEEKAGIACV